MIIGGRSARLRSRTFGAITAFGGTSVGRRVARAVEGLDRAFENDSSDHRSNGESWLLESLAPTRPAVVFDVGANVGTWAGEALRIFPVATVHSFEPIPATYQELVRAGHPPERWVTNNLALTESDVGALPMWEGSHSTLASAVHRPVGGGDETLVESISGDTYCDRAGIDCIDILKVDTEGHDLAVLNGFAGMIAAGKIDVLQFEFTLFAIYARTWLSDFYDLLGPAGYSIGKLYPSWVDWAEYDAHNERFLRCNFVAARRSPASQSIGLV